MIVNENVLTSFRQAELNPVAVLRRIEDQVQVLLRLGIGVGKSATIDKLLQHQATFERFDLVLVAAPTWDILRERSILSGRTQSPVSWLAINPRPEDRCGPLAGSWNDLEQRGCATLAKAVLCRVCPHFGAGPSDCAWPDQLKNIKGHKLVFLTEQQLVINRSLVLLLRSRVKAGRVLVILDEARLLDANFEVVLQLDDLRVFREVLVASGVHTKIPGQLLNGWTRGLDELLVLDSENLARAELSFDAALLRHAFEIQQLGVSMFSSAFRFCGYDLVSLRWSTGSERWRGSHGCVHFIARPYLHCHLLIFSAHLSADYVGLRLGADPIASPFEHHRFCHTGTRVFNLRSRIGADSYFLKNSAQILDVFAVVIARNIRDGRSTLLVSRKSKEHCARYLEGRLAYWGLRVKCVTDRYDTLPATPDPLVVPVIHYGVLGVNDFTDYQSAYCLNSFYISTHELQRHVRQAEPTLAGVKIKITSGTELRRRATVTAKQDLDPAWESLANTYLKKLEIDPVLQAAGRVRFLTRPREVVLFQMCDFSGDLGSCHEAPTLVRLRLALGVPPAKDIDTFLEGRVLRSLMDQGLTAEEAGARLGICRRTAFLRLVALESAESPTSTNSTCRVSCTPLAAWLAERRVGA